MAHIEVGEEALNAFLALVEEHSVVEKKPALDGRFLTVGFSIESQKIGEQQCQK